MTSVAAELPPATTPEVVPDIKAEPEPTVIEPAPVVREPAPVVMEDAATELPVVDATPAQVDTVEPAPPDSVSTNSSEPTPVISEPERVTP